MNETGNSSESVKSQSTATFKPVEVAAILVLAIAAILFLDTSFYAPTLEDAYITFRYSEHLGEGHGFGAWNTQGERVEGYTTFLWMLFLGAGHAIGIDVRTLAKVTGMASHLLLCVVLISFPLLRRNPKRQHDDVLQTSNEVVLAGLFLALYMPLAWYATSGMEVAFFSTLTGLAIVSPFLPYSAATLPLLSGLLILTRPEGVVVAASAIALSFIVCVREKRSFRVVYIATVIAMLSLSGLVAHRFTVFGEIVPNTYFAKAGGAALHHAEWGIKYVYDFTLNHVIVVFLICAGAIATAFSLRGKQAQNWPWVFIVMCGFLVAYLAYVVKVGGDNYSAFPYWRHFVHVAAFIVLLLAYSLIRLWPQSRHFQLLLVLLVAFITNLYILRDGSMWQSFLASRSYPSFTHSTHNQYYTELKRLSEPNTVIASSLGGELPYVVDDVHIDILGLNTSQIAKYGSFDPRGPQDSKTDMAWVLEQRPDLIEGYIPGTMVMTATPEEMRGYIEGNWRSKMHRELVSSPIFQKEYMFVRNWPYNAMDRALFIRQSYASARQLVTKLDCIPLKNTPLSMFERESDNN